MLKFIGEILTPYQTLEDCPSNIREDGPLCEIKIYDEYKDGLYSLKKGKRILILYWFDTENRVAEIVERRDGSGFYGTFALRTPHRPNPIAASTLPITKIEGNSIFVKGLDCLSGTKLLDIKPSME